MAEGRARLERYRRNPPHVNFHFDYIVGGRECSVRGLRVAETRVDEDIVRRLVPNRRGARCESGL